MQDETITYAADPLIVADTVQGQHDALVDASDACPQDYTTIHNAAWTHLFGLYWGLAQIMGLARWRRHWAKVKAYRQANGEGSHFLDLWCWLEEARDWRRDQVRTQKGRGKRRWKILQQQPQKHDAHKALNREAQRRCRARQHAEAAR